MSIIKSLAAEVRADIGLFGPIDAKVLARWLGMELVPMPFPADGLVESYRVPAAVYYAMAGEYCAQHQVARAACTYLLMWAGFDLPTEAQVQALSALLCGKPGADGAALTSALVFG